MVNLISKSNQETSQAKNLARIATKMFLKGIILFATISAIFCTVINPCKTGHSPVHVQVNECIEQPCIFESGAPLDANVTFDAPHDIVKMETAVSATIGLLTFNYPIDSDTCKFLVRGWCPLEESERATFNFQMTLPPIPTEIKLSLKITIKAVHETTKEEIVCFNVAGKTKPS